MKYRFFVLSIFLLLLSCEKDEEEKPKTTAELLRGSWSSVKVSSYSVLEDNGDTTNYFSIGEDMMQMRFESNEVFVLNILGDSARGKYQLNGLELIAYAGVDTLDGSITRIDGTSLIVEDSEFIADSAGNYTNYEYLEFKRK